MTAVWDTVEVESETETEVPLFVVDGEYIYLRVTEQGGQDNPEGDGDDEFNNETDAPSADGKRDNLNDSAWTSPIWFTAAKRIGAANRPRTGEAVTSRHLVQLSRKRAFLGKFN